MSRVFMDFAVSGEILFKARCGAKDFFDSLSPGFQTRGLFYAAASKQNFDEQKFEKTLFIKHLFCYNNHRSFGGP